ncbi:MAG: nucleoside transporter C-terminal domain-containing protein [Pirellulaceae bacterium]
MWQTRLACLAGLLAFVGLAWLFSTNRRRFPIRIVAGGILLQLFLAMMVLRTGWGAYVFEQLAAGVDALMGFVDQGTGFVFNINPREDDVAALPPQYALLRTFAFGVLPTIIFFSALMSMLYHIGLMQRIVWLLAWVMQRSLGTSGPETLSAAANVFVGHTEAPLVVRPYLSRMTRSELNALMTGGFATVTGGLLGVYSRMGIDIQHLLTASVISAPAALLIAKLMVPEESSDSLNRSLQIDSQRTSVNLIGAAVEGASDGLKLALNVAAMLIAFLALIALVNAILLRLTGVSLESLLGFVFSPLAFGMGVPWSESLEAGRLIGLKTVANEFIAYDALGRAKVATAGEAIATAEISERTKIVLTYALAGFSNFGAIGIQVGGIGGLEPSRKDDLARLGLRAMFGGLLACCMTGAIAGLLL